MPETTLEEFLEELDALTDANADELKDQDAKTKQSPSPDSLSTPEEASESAASVSAAILREDTPTQEKAEASSSRGLEKKVRFSEELIQGAHARQTTGSQESESRGPSSLKASSPKKNKHEMDDGSLQDKGGGPAAPSFAQQQGSETDCTKKDSSPPTAPSSPPAEKACTPLHEIQPVELPKCNISNTSTGTPELQRA